MAEQNEPRVYGMPDGNDRAAPASEGLRGERTSLDPGAPGNPALSRQVALDSGNIVQVTEDSGVGWAEAVGRAGLVKGKPHLEPAEDRGVQGPPASPKVMPRQQTGGLARVGGGGKLLIGLAAAALVALIVVVGADRLTSSA